jgi:RHS repeat-associated protein
MPFNNSGRRASWVSGTCSFLTRRTATGRSRLAGAGALGAALPLLAGLAAAAPHPAVAPARGGAPAPARQVPVSVYHYGPAKQRFTMPVMRLEPRPVVRWPTAGTATATMHAQPHAAELTARAGNVALAMPSPGSARAGSLPVEIGPPDAAPRRMPAAVRVSVASHAAAQKAGVSGMVLTLTRADGGRAAGRVHVSVNYASFADADWGGYAGRLRLVELPRCALTRPGVPACRQQAPLVSHNDVQTATIGADVWLPASASGTGMITLGLSEGPSGSSGSYAAEPLVDSANWSAGGNSGAFTYSYSLNMPPVPGGLKPSVAFDYDSQTVDGLTSSTNDQASWIGDGWNYDPGYIERDYQTCADNTSLPTADQTGDLCWNSSTDVTTMVLNGTSTTLVQSGSTWVAEAGDGEQITYVKGSGSNGTYDDDYWKVEDTNGTTYYFGENELPGYASGDAPTGSALTVPVYGPVSGDPCYNATFSKASCPQAWRWELDYVTDAHGDAIAYFYNHETNYYAADKGTKATASYIQASALSKIEYGLRAGAVYGATPAAEVLFTEPETRTDIPTSTSNGNTDLSCASGATCSVTSPTFWSKYQLTTVATEALNGTTLDPVDSWSLAQGYENTSTASSPALWLESIRREGEDGSTDVKLPPVTFAGQPYQNRVNVTDGYDPITRYRLTGIVTETDQDIVIDYSSPSCPATRPADDDNTSLCFPDWWTPTNKQSFEDWFNKYVVTSVTTGDGYSTDAQPAVTTSYCYGSQSNCLSGGAWHYDDDTLVRSDQRTWDQWRGFAQVWTTTGPSTDPVTQTEDQYFRGMNGDYQNGNPTTSASLTSVTGNVTVPDSDQYAGMDFEHIIYNGAGGPMVTDTVTTPWSLQTGSQAQPTPLPALTAYITGPGQVQTFTALASGGNRESDTTYGHNSYGLVTWKATAPDAYDDGTAGPAAEDSCTQTSYAQNTTTNLVDLPAEVVVTSITPANCPITYSASSPPPQGELVSDTRYYYDSSATLGAQPSAGDLTETSKATSYTGSTEEFTTQAQDTYDEYGRIQTATDADGNTTTTAYTPATGGEPTSVTVTTPPTPNVPAGLSTVTAYDPLRELPVTVTAPDGTVTSETYDALGRLTAVWLPTASKSGGQDASLTYDYSHDPDNAGPSMITTTTVEPSGTAYLPSETFYDSAGQQIETQTENADGNTDVTMTFYNAEGWEDLQFNSFYAAGTPSASLVSAQDDAVPDQTGYDYDGAGRVISQVTYHDATEMYETDTSYGGDYTTVTPPSGGTPETTYTNGEGETIYLYQYHSSPAPASPPAPGTKSSASFDETAYTYYPSGLLDTITDAAGNQWSYAYDLAGDRKSATTPDSGTTGATYDNDGNLLSTTNADQQTISYHYDGDGRMDGEYAGPVASQSTSDQLAAWVYDTLAKGRLTSATAYVGGASGEAYAEDVLGYTTAGLSKGTETVIPAGPLAGKYYTEDFYDNVGDLDEYLDLAVGGLPQETVDIGYNNAAQPVSITSALASYVSALSYTELGQPQEYNFGPTTDPAYLNDSYDYRYQLQEATTVTGTTPVTVDDQNFAYDDNGDITSDADTPSGGATQVQCFQYDYLARLTTAWSQASSDCSAGPSQSAEAAAAAPYWDSYQYNTENDLTSQVSTPPTGPATTYTSTFPATTGADGPHAIDNQQAQVAGGATSTTSYTYDQAGFTTSITAGGSTDTLDWNGTGQVPGQLAAVSNGSGTVASYIYDASGSLLLQTDGSTTTLYLPDEQITSSGGTSSGVRYYSLGGQTVAARTSAGAVSYLTGNQQDTDTVAINAATLGVTTRYFDPYGNPVGPAPSSWPDTRGFVGGTTDTSTGLTNLGAREYNPGAASFISPDSLLNAYDPQDLNPYAYALDSPVTQSDPTGLSAPGASICTGSPNCNGPGDGANPGATDTSTTTTGGSTTTSDGTAGNGPLSHARKSLCEIDYLACVPTQLQFNEDFEATPGNGFDWDTSDLCGALTAGVADFMDCGGGGLAPAGGEEDTPEGQSGAASSGSDDDLTSTLLNAALQILRAEADGVAAEDAGTAGDAAAGSSEARSPLGLVIGRTSDLLAPGAIGPDESTLLDKLTPELGSPQANWYRNAGALRAALNDGITEIRDASPGDSGGQFLNAERNLLQNRGWTFDPITNTWYAP